MITILIHDYDNDIDSGDPKNGVFGRRRAFRESCRGGFQPHRVGLLPIHEADLQVPSQSLFLSYFSC